MVLTTAVSFPEKSMPVTQQTAAEPLRNCRKRLGLGRRRRTWESQCLCSWPAKWGTIDTKGSLVPQGGEGRVGAHKGDFLPQWVHLFLEIKRAIYSVLGMMRFLAFMRFSFTFFTTLTHCCKCSEFGYTFCFITQVYFNFSIPCFSLGVYVWIWMYV